MLRRYEYLPTEKKMQVEIDRLRDLLAWNGIEPDAIVESAKGADRERKKAE